MKKILCSILALSLLTAGARADEGMWLLPLLQQMNSNATAELGCRLSPDQIYSINHSSLKDAIVSFGGGCTGEMISQEGLLVTNHHCGYSSIQGLSTPEHNYLEDGYWAMTRDKELPVRGLSVTFLENMTDVTEILNKAYEKGLKDNKKVKDAAEREELAQKARQDAATELTTKAQADYPGCRIGITSFYNENVYYMIVYRTYTDVRFVGAPPASMGKFGGETDNWMWPRHTCDFSMFRVYAGKDNMPAAYSPDNVPYVPKQALKVSLKGVQDGDFAMIMGYPGRTQRFQTADQLNSMMAQNGIAVKARTVRQNVMWQGMEEDPVVRLQYANKYANSANGWKKWQGEELAFQKLNIIGRELQKEADFMSWVSKDKKRNEKYGKALEKISQAVKASDQAQQDMTLLTESVYRIGLLSNVSAFVQPFSRRIQAGGDTTGVMAQAVNSAAAQFRDFNEPLERKMAVALLNFYRDNAKPENYINEIGDFAHMDFQKYVDDLFDNSVFSSEEKLRKGTVGKSSADLSDDPAVILYNAVVTKVSSFYPAVYGSSDLLAEGSKEFTAGLMEWKKGEPSYPDANSTMRLTYGNVKSYSPKDGVTYWHYTTLGGVMEKENPDDYEFKVPARLKELYEAKDFGQYANAAGDLPVCFLTNNDITGGNSGSPVLNADGELIGLAFDGNWESMSSDVMFEPDLQRCICVDIRYVLFVVDKFGGAKHLIDELTLVK
ncbi:MAG: S46 family peptidase [Bacteroidales bacterium]|nr:S46 family peptidase [Bacteroidales bacterium]